MGLPNASPGWGSSAPMTAVPPLAQGAPSAGGEQTPPACACAMHAHIADANAENSANAHTDARRRGRVVRSGAISMASPEWHGRRLELYDILGVYVADPVQVAH